MAKFNTILALFGFLLIGSTSFAQDEGGVAQLSVEADSVYVGEVEEGDTVKYIFKFTNTGDAPLVIDAVKPSCGCTGTDYTPDPVAPGETGEIELTYATYGHPGHQHPTMKVIYNGAPRMVELKVGLDVVGNALMAPEEKKGEELKLNNGNSDDNTLPNGGWNW